jgi:hypothetical protein
MVTHKVQLFGFLYFFFGAGAQTQGLAPARQVLYHWPTSLALVFFEIEFHYVAHSGLKLDIL